MTRPIEFSQDEFYHLYNRGTERRNIFSSEKDRQRFLALLYACNSRESVRIDNLRRGEQGSTLLKVLVERGKGDPLVDIAAYCLMPNHFHLLVREIEEGGISKFMQKLMTAYTMYFNVRHERSGALFQGKFKATHVHDDRYLRYLIAYIHLNPVKLIDPKWKEDGLSDLKKAEDFLSEYPYSSYLDYFERDRGQGAILNMGTLPGYFKSPKSFKENITEWLDYARKD